MRWLLVALFTTAAAFAAAQNASLPDGDGKAIVTGSCTSCHDLGLITAKTATREEWAGIVDRMKSYGTALDAKQTTTVVDYLAKSFGPKTQAPAAPAPAPPSQAAPPAQDTAAADAAGKAIVDGACASCHATDLITTKNSTREEWQGVIDRMKSYGTAIDDKQTGILLDYLVRRYGPKQQASAAPAGGPDPGKALLDVSCSNCHDLDIVAARTGTQAEWQEVVDRMNARGAGVAEKDVPALVSYLAKTYPVKK
jgi:cytochrome c5